MREALGMERQRSFCFKPKRLFVFSFTICSSIMFIILFTVWVIKITPLVPQETHLQLNASSLVKVQTLTGVDRNSSKYFKGSILINTQFRKSENASGFSDIGGLQIKKSESEVEDDEENEEGGFIENSPPMAEAVPGISSEKNEEENVAETSFNRVEIPSGESVDRNSSILINTLFRKPENASGFSGISVIGGLQIKKSESEVVENEDGGFTENLTPMVETVLGKSSEKNLTETSTNNVEIPSGEIRIEEKNQETAFEKALVSSIEKVEEKRTRDCEVTRGKWVYDESYPLYTNGSCPFIDEGFNCEGNGRPDKGYMKLRWQPKDCDIPRFNATKMLELIRGKRLVFVGDSINRNQWESMLCMLVGAIRDPKKVYETHGRRITKEKGNYSFRFVDYRCTVEYYVTHFLVHEGKARVGQKRVQTLRIDSIDRGSSRWKRADILVFNTAHWWSHYKTKAGINYYQEGGQVHPRLDVSTAFRKALTTWASWVDKNINPRKTQVFFRSSASSHFRGGQWNSGGHCKEATLPLQEVSSTFVSEKNIIVEEVIKQMKTPVTVLNITALSEYRIDGHPSVYGRRSRKPYSSSIQDCSHWCLPGVPDSWNEILYAHLQSKRGLTGFRLVN